MSMKHLQQNNIGVLTLGSSTYQNSIFDCSCSFNSPFNFGDYNYTITAIDNIGHQSSHSLNFTQVNNYQDKFQLSCWSWLNRLFDYPSICGSDIDSALKEIFI